MPVPATSLDEIVNSASELNAGPQGALYAGMRHDPIAPFDVQGYLVSDDGAAAGDNLHIVYLKHDHATGHSEEVGEGVVSHSVIGGIDVISFIIPEHIAQMTHLNKDEVARFVFVESELDGTPLVRAGEFHPAGSVEFNVVLNDIAKDDVVDNFHFIF